MPHVTSRQKSDELVIAIDDGWLQQANGASHLIKRGMRLRATHEAVRLAPGMFVSADLDDIEIAQARRALLDSRGIYGRD